MQKGVIPSNYKILLEPDFKTFTFKGSELITLQIKQSVKSIHLDAVNLKVESCSLVDGGSKEKLEFKVTKDALLITISGSFKDGENVIEIIFQGELNNKLAGFYRSDYDEDGKVKYLATTQFEAADARQAFPCFDEPAAKATFDITLIVDKHLTAISNMPVVIEEETEGDLGQAKKSITFETTPVMSTYLLYFGVGEFEIKEDAYKNILLRGITTKGKSEQTAFALDVAKKSLEYFEEYFNIPYPLPKLDLLAIPDFASGAMENWGAITFRENALLYYEGDSSLSTKQRITEVVAHELAHQWFGNLVTMKWWDDLWLNESFATFMAYKVIDKYWPEWDIWTQYIMQTVFEGMALDSLNSSHAIKVKVTSIEEMNELFDEIAYDKGGSILRMVERFMGEVPFRAGLRIYMSAFKYKNTEASDLWKVLDKQDPAEIESLVEKFVTQVGFPYVTVDKEKLTQKRFLFNNDKDSSAWDIPLVVQCQDSSEKNMVMSLPEMQFEDYKNLQTVNGDYGGFFISNYTPEVLLEVSKSYNLLTPREKIGLIHDLYYLSKFQKQPFNIFLKFITEVTKAEKESSVLYYIVEVLDFITLLKETDEVVKLTKYYAKRGLEIIGLEPKASDTTNHTFLRAVSLSVLSQMEDKEVNTFLTEKLTQYFKNASSLHPDLKAVTYSNAVWSNATHYEKIKELYKTTSVQEEKVKLLSALANTKDKKVLKETLDYCLSPEVRFANVFYALNSASKNPACKEVTLNWIIEQWAELGKRVGGHGGTLLRRFVKIIIPTCGIGREEIVKKFIDQNRIAGLEKTFEQVWEELEINTKFAKNIQS